jgi:hypothetical protein
MRLFTLQEYRLSLFSARSAPAIKTLRKRFDRIPGARWHLGRRYIDMDVHDRETRLVAQLEQQRKELLECPELEGLT